MLWSEESMESVTVLVRLSQWHMVVRGVKTCLYLAQQSSQSHQTLRLPPRLRFTPLPPLFCLEIAGESWQQRVRWQRVDTVPGLEAMCNIDTLLTHQEDVANFWIARIHLHQCWVEPASRMYRWHSDETARSSTIKLSHQGAPDAHLWKFWQFWEATRGRHTGSWAFTKLPLFRWNRLTDGGNPICDVNVDGKFKEM